MSKYILHKEKELENLKDLSIEIYGFKHRFVETKDEEQTHRTRLRRQRDKILYTGGFRRLQDKTQVISSTKEGDHRTRLTHTLEVEQIACSIADTLGLNKDLVSAIALGHDVGHTPFGHAAERKLNELLEDGGKFHHSIQSVKYLWNKYGENISYMIYEGILKHDTDMCEVKINEIDTQINSMSCKDKKYNDEKNARFKKYIKEEIKKVPCTLEAQVVIWADKIAYITHDYEDFYKSNIYYELKKNDEGNQIVHKLNEILSKIIKEGSQNHEIRDLIRYLLNDLLEGSARNLKEYFNFEIELTKEELIEKIKDKTNERIIKSKFKKTKQKYLDGLIINFSNSEFIKNYFDLREFLDEYYIKSTSIQRSDAKAYKIIENLYKEFSKNIRLLPISYYNKYEEQLGLIIDENIKKFNINLDENNINKEEIIKHLEFWMLNKDIKYKKILSYINDKEDSFKKKLKQDINKYVKMMEEIYPKHKGMKDRMIADYISTMSDTYAKYIYSDLNTSGDYFL